MPALRDPSAKPRFPLDYETMGLAGLLVYVLAATAFALTPSHFQQAANLMGLESLHPLFGLSRPARSDEWGVSTAYFQIAVASDFGARDLVSPYHTPLKAFFALPSRDWSMVFKPDLWGFLVLDPARAFALHYALLASAALSGGYLLLRHLGARREVSGAVAGLLFFSPFVQAWWTSNAPVLALALWPAVAYLWRAPWWARLPAIAAAIAVWLIGQLYPPFILATGLALAIAIAAFRPDSLRPGRLAVGALSAAAGVAIACLHYANLIPAMAATVYPGRRIFDGGGLQPLQFIAHVFPHITTLRWLPATRWLTNYSELSVVGSYLPLAVACFCDGRSLGELVSRRRRALAIWAGGLLVMAVWMLLPVPAAFAPVLNMVAGPRLLWGFGLLLMMGLAVIASEAAWRVTPARAGAFLLIAVGAWFAGKLWLAPAPLNWRHLDWWLLPIFLGVVISHRLAPRAIKDRRIALSAILAASVVTFGLHNPIQSGKPIFEVPASPALDSLRAYARANPRGVAVPLGLYAGALNGAGIPAINHVLVRPDLAFFRTAYPQLNEAALNRLFNRYAHIMPALVWSPALVQDDLVAVPPDPFAMPLRVDAASATATATASAPGVIELAQATDLGGGRLGVMIGGWTDWIGAAAEQGVSVSLDPAAGRIVSASAFRLPRPIDAQRAGGAARFASGFGVRLVIETPNGAPPPAGSLRLIARDARGAWPLQVPAVVPAAAPAIVWPVTRPT